MVNTGPTDLLHFLESVFGLQPIKTEIEEKGGELGHVQGELMFCRGHVDEARAQLQALQPAMDAYNRHQEREVEYYRAQCVHVGRVEVLRQVGQQHAQMAMAQARQAEEAGCMDLEAAQGELEQCRSTLGRQNTAVKKAEQRAQQAHTKHAKALAEQAACRAEIVQVEADVVLQQQAADTQGRRASKLQLELDGCTQLLMEARADHEALARSLDETVSDPSRNTELARLKKDLAKFDREHDLAMLEAGHHEAQAQCRQQGQLRHDLQTCSKDIDAVQMRLAAITEEEAAAKHGLDALLAQCHALDREEEALKKNILANEQAHTRVERQLQSLHRETMQGESSGIHVGGAAWAAIAQLQEQMGPDRLHGYVKDVLHLAHTNHAVPVNMALRQRLRNVVVSSRRDGLAVVDYFRSQRIGQVTCEILDDCVYQAPAMRHGGAEGTYLADAVVCDKQYAGLVGRLLGKWRLCSNYEAACTLMEAQRHEGSREHSNIVSMEGYTFTSSGDIRKPSEREIRSVVESPYTLTTRTKARPVAHRITAVEKELQERLHSDIIRLEEELGRLEAAHAELHRQQGDLEQQRLSTQQEIGRYVRNHGPSLPAVMALCPGPLYRSKVVGSARRKVEGELAKLKDRHSSIEKELAGLRVDAGAEARYRQTMQQRDALRSKIADIDTAGAVREQLAAKAKLLKDLARKEAAIRGRFNTANSKAAAALSMVGQLKERLQTLTQQAAEHEEKTAKLKEELDSRTAVLEAMRAECLEANTKVNHARRHVQAQHERQQMHSNHVHACQAACREAQAALQATATERHTATTKLVSLLDCPDDILKDVEHEVEKYRAHLQEKLASTGPEGHGGHISKEQSKAEGAGRDLAGARQGLDRDYAGLDHAAVDHYRALKGQVTIAEAQLVVLQQQQQQLIATLQQLEATRYQLFKGAMDAINTHLSTLYRQLTGDGDCYLEYMADQHVYQLNGVALRVRPPRQADTAGPAKYMPFSALSGGQQALGALALSLAVGHTFPSALTIYDEIDASLDIATIDRVARLLLSLRSTQFVTVSLRPQIYEHCPCLVGVYHQGATSRCVMLRESDTHGACKRTRPAA